MKETSQGQWARMLYVIVRAFFLLGPTPENEGSGIEEKIVTSTFPLLLEILPHTFILQTPAQK